MTPAAAMADQAPRVRVGVLGYGYWGPQLARNLSTIPQIELVGIADSQPDRLARAKELYPQIEHFLDHRQLLEADVDAVVIATPIQTHFALARAALVAGKHILVEKPLTASADEALALVDLSREVDRVLMVGHTFVYNPAVRELRRIVQSGELGEILCVDSARLSLGLFQRHFNVLWDLAPHDISILLYVLQQVPVMVSARGRSLVRPDVHDVAYLEVMFEDGVTAQIHVSWLDPVKVRRLTVVGNRRMAVYDDMSAEEKIRIYDSGVERHPTDRPEEYALSYRRGAITIPFINWQEPLHLECEHFVNCIVTGHRPLSDGAQGMIVAATLETAAKSLANGGIRLAVRLPSEDLPSVSPVPARAPETDSAAAMVSAAQIQVPSIGPAA